MLFENMYEPFVFMEKTHSPDGEGGYKDTYTQGYYFDGVAIRDTSMTARVAYKDGMQSVFTVTTSKNVHLSYHDVIKRVSDGKILRITTDSADKKSPEVSSLNIAQVTAEEWKIPT